MFRYLIVGSGYRAKFYGRIAHEHPAQFEACFLTRSSEKAALMKEETGIDAVVDKEAAIAFQPDAVVIAVNKTAIASVGEEWLKEGYPVILETPAGLTNEELETLWNYYRQGAKILVAEQYHRMPEIAAGLEVIRQGLIGAPTSAYLSLAHDYHGASLLRRVLSTDGESYTIQAIRSVSSGEETDSRNGPITSGVMNDHTRTQALITYASGKTAVYDFCGLQYHSFIRSRHITVRGEKGEWSDTCLRYVDETHQPATVPLEPLVQEKYRALWSGPLPSWSPALVLDRTSDEFAIKTMLWDMKEYLTTSREVYPFKEAIEDALFLIKLEESVERGCPVEAEPFV